jgi:hypothetical protein
MDQSAVSSIGQDHRISIPGVEGSGPSRRALSDSQLALLKRLERNVNAAAWNVSKRSLPSGIDEEDLRQEGMIFLLEVLDKFDWKDSPQLGAYLSKALDGRMRSVINLARYGIASKPRGDDDFEVISYEQFNQDGSEEYDFLERGGADQFGFERPSFKPPIDRESRLKIYRGCAEVLAREFPTANRYQDVSGIWYEPSGWRLRMELLGGDCSMSGFKSKKDAAKTKYRLLKISSRLRFAYRPE